MRADAIRIARVSPRLAGVPRLRPTLERWLAECDLSHHGLPPEAIVLVRCLRTNWRDLAADDRAARYSSFATLLGGARRPASGNAEADVVWFVDEAELLACIARDAISGALHGRWWWRALATGAWQATPEVTRWLQAPHQVPPAVQRLGATRTRAWFARWSPGEQAALVAALGHRYTVAGAVAQWVLNGAVSAIGPTTCAADVASPMSTGPEASVRAHRPHEITTLPERLHALCAALADNAGAARDADSVALMASHLPVSQPSAIARKPAAPTARARETSTATSESSMHASSLDQQADDTAALRRGVPAPPTLWHVPSSQPSPREAWKAPHAPLFRSADDPHAPRHERDPVVAAPLDPPTAVDDRLAEPAGPTSLQTRHGGLLFVLNAALQLSLYGDFTQPMHPGLPCTPWRFLWLAGHAWCGRPFRADPLAAWLEKRDLAIGPRCNAGPIADWRIDPAWLAPFAPAIGPWVAGWQAGRFSLRHPAGFTVCDLETSSEGCEALIADEADRLGLAFEQGLRRTVHTRRRARPARPSASRRHGCPEPIWPYLHARLALALDDGDGIASRRRVAAMLALPAQLRTSGDQRLDLDCTLGALPLAVRLAGLDRDPGWIPSAGCDVRFHFS